MAAFAAVMLLSVAGVAQAASPHYVKGPTVTVSGTSLTVSWKAAGLGTTEDSVDFAITGSVDVFSRCYNHGGNKPQAENKQETIAVNVPGTFDVRNGQTTGSLSVTPLSTLTCPGKQVVKIESVSWDLFLNGDGLLEVHLVGP